jgi:hypothetical protein
MKESQNPLRACKKCGTVGNSYMHKNKSGYMIYTPFCKKCINERNKNRIITICRSCGCEKVSNYQTICYECSNNNISHTISYKITYEELVEIGYFMRKCEVRGWMTDIYGISRLIDVYDLIKKHQFEYDSYGSGKQLSHMFNNLKKVYLQIKDLNKEQLQKVDMDKRFLIIINEKEVKQEKDSDLQLFFDNIKSFKIDDKIYSLEKEYADSFSNKYAAVRSRKIIQELKRNLTILRFNTFQNRKK